MAITDLETQHVAQLAKLSFTQEELPVFTAQMDKIIEMVELLEAIDTTGVPLTTSVTDRLNVTREDVAVAGTDRDELMKNAPDEKDGYIRVPAIMETGEVNA